MASKSLGALTLDLIAKTGGFVDGMDKAERSAKKMEGEYKRLKQSIDPAFAAQERFTKASAVLKRELDRGALSLTQYNADLKKLEMATKLASSEAVRPLGGSIQQVGYQVGDFAVQLASGQSALVAFTQQGAQLAGFFGPGGAVLGAVLAIGGAVAGYLVRSLGEGEDATDALTAAMQRLDEVTTKNDGIQTLTDDIRELAKESELAARARIVSAMAAAEAAAKSAAKGIRDAFDGAIDTAGFSDLSDFFTANNIGGAIKDVAESLGLAGKEGRKAAGEIFVALKALDAKPTIENFKALESVVAETSTTIGAASKPLQTLVGSLSQYFDGARSAADRTEYLKKVLGDLSLVVNEEANGAITEMIDKLRVQADTLGLTSLEMIEYSKQTDLKEAADKGATAEQIKAINAAYAKIAAHEKETEAQKKATEAAKEAAAEQARINSQALSIAESLLSEEDAILASYERRRQIILDNTAITGEAQKNLLTKLEQEKNDELSELNAGYWEKYLAAAEENLSSFDELAGNMLESFSGRFGDVFETMIFDAEDLGDAVSGMAEGMARSVVNALGEMAAQWLAYQAVQLVTGQSAQAAAVAGAAVAGTAMASAYAPAAAFASLASFGANAAPAAAALTTTTALAEGLSLLGMAHEGIDSIPQTGTWLLEKGERVTTAETSAKLDRTLDQVSKSQGGGAPVTIINQTTGRIDKATERTLPNGERAILIEEMIATWNGMARDPNSSVSRTMSSSLNVQRKR